MRDKNLALMVAAMSMMVSGPADTRLSDPAYGYSLNQRGPQGPGGKAKRRDKQKSARKDRQANRRKAKGK